MLGCPYLCDELVGPYVTMLDVNLMLLVVPMFMVACWYLCWFLFPFMLEFLFMHAHSFPLFNGHLNPELFHHLIFLYVVFTSSDG
jgi:hypothetical protein